jgi:hypothetical protein
MKLYLITAAVPILLSSCLKQSIPDAMLASQESGGGGGATATLSFKINGNAVNISVSDAESQDPNAYTLGCTKSVGYYTLDGLSNTGEITFGFYTDSLTIGNYKYTGNYGDMYFIMYNGQDEYAHVATDSMSFNITSDKNGLISGNFSGQLTPMISAGIPYNTYGAPGSTLITNGSFKNVPVFY